MDVRTAYLHCEQVTWSQARNFSYGIRLLPPAKRQALAAVYAFARRIDDIGDGSLPSGAKLAALAETRASVEALLDGHSAQVGAASAPGLPGGGPPVPAEAPSTAAAGVSTAAVPPVSARAAGNGRLPAPVAPEHLREDPVLVALADAARRFDIPLAAFGELIDGCEADVRGVSYQTFDDLLHYCRCVAGSIGRLSLGVFGADDVAVAVPLADALGVALQLTNILRDVREDYLGGRVYLPAEDLGRFGCSLERGIGGDRDEGLAALVRFEAERARDWYSRGLTLIPLLDRRSAASAGAMAGIYYRLLEHITASPHAVLTRRVSLSPGQKALVAGRSLLMAVGPGRRRRPGARPPAGGGPA